MWTPVPFWRLVVLGSAAGLCGPAWAQQVTIETPVTAVSDGFFENMGTSWGLQGRNWGLSVFGSPLQAAPQFGGFSPSAGANFGAGFRRDGVSGYFNANWSQGYRQTLVSQTPKITLQNGVPGFIFEGSTTPFVISNIPVVGNFPVARQLNPGLPPAAYSGQGQSYGNPVQEALMRAQAQRAGAGSGQAAGAIHQAGRGQERPPRPAANVHDDLVLTGADGTSPSGQSDDPLPGVRRSSEASSAARPAPSVAEARRTRQAEAGQTDQKVLGYVDRGKNAEAAGKNNVAKVYYQMAYRRAEGKLKEEIFQRIRSLDGSP